MKPLPNPVGSAPGLVGLLRERMVALLPGVPAELAGLLPAVKDWLRDEGILQPTPGGKLWRTAQIAELSLVERCAAVRTAYPRLGWAWWLTEWGVDLRITASEDPDNEQDMAAAESGLDSVLGLQVFSRERKSLPEVVQEMLLSRQTTVAVAESCTGGLLAARLTDQAGASAVFRGGVVTYADQTKGDLLGVPHDVLAQQGAVSEAVARAMASGCRTEFAADYALGVTGIAGPGGGSPDKPVGTTWIAVATSDAVFARRYRFPADRRRNRLLAVAAALDTLRRVLQGGAEQQPWLPTDDWGR
jgi:nicotinamide-nucleotide amidase